MEAEAPFEPLNDLEVRLVQAQDGTLQAPEFLDSLLSDQVFVLLDKPVGPDADWDESINPLVLTSEADEPMFAVFSAIERAGMWSDQLPQFENALQVEVRWLLGAISDGVGLVLNPGFDIGMEMIPDAVVQLKQRADAFTRGEAR
ncbi:SseB family protein [Stenotrophomonas tumulicola]|uniref:SseB family protein n=1 Tax=Stenotrophomonas tumulicola TaxID=1685415 RepID=A0A7W3FLA4_9GAMM|nr:SseB family protein [Stenotrophomonas tumulicola]